MTFVQTQRILLCEETDAAQQWHASEEQRAPAEVPKGWPRQEGSQGAVTPREVWRERGPRAAGAECSHLQEERAEEHERGFRCAQSKVTKRSACDSGSGGVSGPSQIFFRAMCW